MVLDCTSYVLILYVVSVPFEAVNVQKGSFENALRCLHVGACITNLSLSMITMFQLLLAAAPTLLCVQPWIFQTLVFFVRYLAAFLYVTKDARCTFRPRSIGADGCCGNALVN